MAEKNSDMPRLKDVAERPAGVSIFFRAQSEERAKRAQSAERAISVEPAQARRAQSPSRERGGGSLVSASTQGDAFERSPSRQLLGGSLKISPTQVDPFEKSLLRKELAGASLKTSGSAAAERFAQSVANYTGVRPAVTSSTKSLPAASSDSSPSAQPKPALSLRSPSLKFRAINAADGKPEVGSPRRFKYQRDDSAKRTPISNPDAARSSSGKSRAIDAADARREASSPRRLKDQRDESAKSLPETKPEAASRKIWERAQADVRAQSRASDRAAASDREATSVPRKAGATPQSPKAAPRSLNPLQEPLIKAGSNQTREPYGKVVQNGQVNGTTSGKAPLASNGLAPGVQTDTSTGDAPASCIFGGDPEEWAALASRGDGFSFVFVFPLPSVTTDEENKAFAKKHLPGKSYANAASTLEHVILSPASRRFERCRTLRELRNVTIGMFQSLLASLAESLQGQLRLFQFTSEDCDEFFICIHVSDLLGEKLACMSDYPLQLSLEALEELQIRISDTDDLLPAYIGCDTYLSKENWLKQFLQPQRIWSESDTILRPVDTMRLLYDKITDYIDLFELQRLGLLSHVYPAHDRDELLILKRKWAEFQYIFSTEQPIEEVRDYFGEGVAFFFLFNGFMAKSLKLLLFPAIACEVAWQFGAGDEAQAILCLILVIWSTSVVKFWRRTESFYACKWGMDKYVPSATKDPINPRFKGGKKPSTLDENILVLRADPHKVVFGYTISIITSFLFTCIVITAMEWNQQWQAVEEQKGNTMSSYIGAVILSIQIQIWDKIWDFLIVGRLNDLEQHVTQYAFDQSRVAKTFVIKFINAFNAFWYIAYIQPQFDTAGCGGDCKEYLRVQLLIVMATYIGYGVLDVALAFVGLKVPVWQEQRKIQQHGHKVFKMSLLEMQAKMSEYGGRDERNDYLSVLFPLAFVMLFGSMTPATVPLAWIALSSQLRTHAWKMVDAVRRPFPARASGVGVWDPILTFITYVAVFNSIGLLVVQVDSLGSMVPGFVLLTQAIGMESKGLAAKTLLFFILQNVVAIFKSVFDFLVSDVTSKTQLERDRQMLQRMRIAHKGHAEFHEVIELRGSNDIETCAYHEFPPLEPGHPNHVEALL